MVQARRISAPVGPVRVADARVSLQPYDVVISGVATLALVYLVAAARWAPGFWQSAGVFTVIALGPPGFRWLSRKYPQQRVFEIAASFWLLPSAALGHDALGPIVDAAQPELMDKYLSYADLAIFGVHPGVFLEHRIPGWLTEILLLCYYSYYLWPVLLGAMIYVKLERKVFNEYLLALSLLFAANFFFYVLVPAIGPRFFLARQFDGPLQGVWLTPVLDSAMRGPAFMRDCFPSGHTATTLMVLTFAFWRMRRFFWALLPIATGLIAATVVGRFHYGIDLVCAVPLTALCTSSAALLSRVRTQGLSALGKPRLGIRAPARV